MFVHPIIPLGENYRKKSLIPDAGWKFSALDNYGNTENAESKKGSCFLPPTPSGRGRQIRNKVQKLKNNYVDIVCALKFRSNKIIDVDITLLHKSFTLINS